MKVARCAVTLLVATVILGVGVGSAGAALPTPNTLPAKAVTATTSTLEGTVVTGGTATLYQFQYGRTARYGGTTIAHEIPSGRGTVAVAARITGLLPARRYHFQLVAQAGPGTQYYPLVINFGADRSFVTVAGELTLSSSKLTVRKRIAPAELTCVSSLVCKGAARLTLATGHGKHRHRVTLAKTTFRARAHRHATIELALSGKALSLLTAARGHRLGATFLATASSGQAPLSRHVTLILG
ncbi:MAG: hypothetical protein ACRDNK_07185 [Solirubrobacteraceae bacterium]